MAPAAESQAASLIIAAHGDRGGLMANRLAGTVAEQMSETGRFARVAVGFLRGEPPLDEVGSSLPEAAIRIYPLFMSCGYYVNSAIPECLGIGPDGRDASGRAVQIMEPIGVRPVMARIVECIARNSANAVGFKPGETGILLAAHGSSKDPSSRRATETVARQIAGKSSFRRIDCAFLEEPPVLGDALASLEGPLVVVGMFIGEGMHGHDDLSGAIAHARRPDIALAPPLARWPDLAAAVCEDILVTPLE